MYVLTTYQYLLLMQLPLLEVYKLLTIKFVIPQIFSLDIIFIIDSLMERLCAAMLVWWWSSLFAELWRVTTSTYHQPSKGQFYYR